MSNTKDIKDYLHLYLWCECIRPSDGKRFKLTPINLEWAPGEQWMPLLRPLSDMTEEEAIHFAWLCVDSKHHLDADCRIQKDDIGEVELVFNDNGLMLDNDVDVWIGVSVRCFEGGVVIGKDGSIYVSDDEGKKEAVGEVAEKVAYLLSKHFDIFELIAEGLALDATQKEAIT